MEMNNVPIKVQEYFMGVKGKVKNCILIDADPNVGFTIMDSEKVEYIMCYRGDLSPQAQARSIDADPEMDKIMWNYLVEVVTGDLVFDLNEIINRAKDHIGIGWMGHDPTAKSCVFGM